MIADLGEEMIAKDLKCVTLYLISITPDTGVWIICISLGKNQD